MTRSIIDNKSHPVWVRGLKRKKTLAAQKKEEVAPRVGAWIETKEAWTFPSGIPVAPRVGAWIETGIKVRITFPNELSHPVWVRGLKQFTV